MVIFTMSFCVRCVIAFTSCSFEGGVSSVLRGSLGPGGTRVAGTGRV